MSSSKRVLPSRASPQAYGSPSLTSVALWRIPGRLARALPLLSNRARRLGSSFGPSSSPLRIRAARAPPGGLSRRRAQVQGRARMRKGSRVQGPVRGRWRPPCGWSGVVQVHAGGAQGGGGGGPAAGQVPRRPCTLSVRHDSPRVASTRGIPQHRVETLPMGAWRTRCVARVVLVMAATSAPHRHTREDVGDAARFAQMHYGADR